MQRQGDRPTEQKAIGGMPATDDEIREKYLERAIRELNHFTRDLQACPHCPRGDHTPILGSGHPQADVFMLKYAPTHAEIEEGVAYYGRSGTAIMKSLRRLGIDPIAVYGTLCVKCPVPDTAFAAPECLARLVEEVAIVQPKIVVVMGEHALEVFNDVQIPLARALEPRPGEIQKLTPSVDALYTPDIDGALDEEEAKRAFWSAFRVLGDWYADFPPY
jgi:uracil-DNA glycosylase